MSSYRKAKLGDAARFRSAAALRCAGRAKSSLLMNWNAFTDSFCLPFQRTAGFYWAMTAAVLPTRQCVGWNIDTTRNVFQRGNDPNCLEIEDAIIDAPTEAHHGGGFDRPRIRSSVNVARPSRDSAGGTENSLSQKRETLNTFTQTTKPSNRGNSFHPM